MVKICTLNHPSYFKKNAPKIFSALEEIKKYSPLGARLYDWAKKTNIEFYEKDMRYMGLGGNYIVCNKQNSVATNIAIIAHELMHCVQFKSYEFTSFKVNQDAKSRILQGRGLEAAAVACEVRILYEMKLNGREKPWNNLMKNHVMFKNSKGEMVRAKEKYMYIAQHFEKAFTTAKDAGKTEDIAMKEACTAAHQAYFISQDLIDTYNNIYLESIMRYTTKLSKTKSVPTPQITSEDIKNMAQISKGEFLINNFKMPTDDTGIFGNNTLMRQAFEYVEFVRLQNTLGEENYFVIQKVEAMKKDGNPYIGVNLSEVMKELKKDDNRLALEVMNDIAGIGNAYQLQLDFFAISSPKNKRQRIKQQRKNLRKQTNNNIKRQQNRYLP